MSSSGVLVHLSRTFNNCKLRPFRYEAILVITKKIIILHMLFNVLFDYCFKAFGDDAGQANISIIPSRVLNTFVLKMGECWLSSSQLALLLNSRIGRIMTLRLVLESW